ncbi:putative bifunctional diguanylate cyclase/phosphodiesterase [Aureimonas glaciei]|nr:EAL domain-containing protein [Aureimonas glaciei]
MSIKLKILLGCLALTLVTMVVGIVAQHSQRAIGTLAASIYDDALVSTNSLRSAQNAMLQLDATFQRDKAGEAAPTALTPPQREYLGAELTALIADLSVAAQGSISAEGRSATESIGRRLARLQASSGALTGRLLLKELGLAGEEVEAAVRVFAADAYGVRRSVGNMVDASIDRNYLAMAMALLAALAICLALSRTIVPALTHAVSIAQSIAAGNFNNAIRPRGSREIAELMSALAVMQNSIARHFGEIEDDAATQADAYDSRIAVQNARFEAALNNMTQGLCMFDGRGRLAVVNRRFVELFGTVTLGTPVSELARKPALAGIFATGAGSFFTQQMDDGKMLAVSRQGIAAGGHVYTFEDITERHNASLRLNYLANHCSLTDLPNRTRLAERLQEIGADPALISQTAVLCLDLDGFKTVNDTLGHLVGDMLLQAAGRRIRACAGSEDLVARTGGDEFAVVQMGEQPASAERMAAAIIAAMAEPFVIDHHRIAIGVSIGVAIGESTVADNPASGSYVLLKSADLALHAAKALGRNSYSFFEPAMDERLQSRRRTETDLASALEDGEFELFYQPFVNVIQQTISGFEALIRWRHPQRGQISPAEFIPIAEEVGQIAPIGLWVLETACRQAMHWPSPLSVSVNLSPVQFREATLFADVRRILKETGLPPGRLQLEITESVLLHDTESVLAVLRGFRKLGIRISMDDFGTGYSSLGYLSRFPFDKVKIDQSFVRDLAKRENLAVVRAVIGLSKAMGIGVIAEGVETAEQRDLLLAESCDEMQGYYFSKPRPVTEVAAFLEAFNAAADMPRRRAAADLVPTRSEASSGDPRTAWSSVSETAALG